MTLPVLAANLVEDERKLLHRGNDDLLPVRNEPAEITRVIGVSDGSAHLSELLDRVVDLLVENPSIRDDDDGIEDRGIVLLQNDHLVRQPGDGIRLAAPGGVLNQITLALALGLHVGQEPAHHVELVVSRPDLDRLFLACLLVLYLDDLRIVLEDVSESLPGEDALP